MLQPATRRSFHTLLSNESRITSATVGIFSTFRLVLDPPSHFSSMIVCGFPWDVPQILTPPCCVPRGMFADIYHGRFSPRGTSHDTCHGVSHGIRLPMGQPMERPMRYPKIHPIGTHVIYSRGRTLVRLWSPARRGTPHVIYRAVTHGWLRPLECSKGDIPWGPHVGHTTAYLTERDLDYHGISHRACHVLPRHIP